MYDNHTKLTTLFETAGLQDLRGYIYCGLIEKLYKFSILNHACEKDLRMPVPSEDTPQQRFKDSNDFYRPIWDGLVTNLQTNGGDFSAVQQGADDRIAEMKKVLDNH